MTFFLSEQAAGALNKTIEVKILKVLENGSCGKMGRLDDCTDLRLNIDLDIVNIPIDPALMMNIAEI